MSTALSNLVPAVIRNPSRVATAGSNGAWMADYRPADDMAVIRVWHYATLMIAALVSTPMGSPLNLPDRLHGLYLCTGWGSASDQQGLRKIFDSVGLPIRLRRSDGNARFHWNYSSLAIEPVIRDRFDPRGNLPLWVEANRFQSEPVWASS